MNENKTRVGMGFFGWLQLMFIAFQLLGVINWPWWAVFSPILLGVALVVIVFVVLFVAALIDKLHE